METLNLSESTPRGDGRLKSLFWPTIHSATDVDSLGTQGYWVCTLVAVISTALLLAMSQPIAAVATFLMYYAGGVGVRERSPYAAAAVLLMSLAEIVASGPSIPRIIFAALFLSNLRGTWIAAGWKSDSEEADLPPRLNETLGDKLADQFPKWLWPKIRILYYIFCVWDAGVGGCRLDYWESSRPRINHESDGRMAHPSAGGSKPAHDQFR